MYKNKYYIFLSILGLVVMLAACGNGGSNTSNASGENYSIDNIKISHVAPENTAKQAGALAMKEKIEELSDGEIKVDVYPNSTLYGDGDEFDNLLSNNVQFILPDMSKLVSYEPAFDMASLPLVFSSDKAAEEFWDGEYGQEIMSSIEKEGVKPLSMWPNGFRVTTNSKRALKSPEDYKGLKIRTSSGQVLGDVF